MFILCYVRLWPPAPSLGLKTLGGWRSHSLLTCKLWVLPLPLCGLCTVHCAPYGWERKLGTTVSNPNPASLFFCSPLCRWKKDGGKAFSMERPECFLPTSSRSCQGSRMTWAFPRMSSSPSQVRKLPPPPPMQEGSASTHGCCSGRPSVL